MYQLKHFPTKNVETNRSEVGFEDISQTQPIKLTCMFLEYYVINSHMHASLIKSVELVTCIFKKYVKSHALMT